MAGEGHGVAKAYALAAGGGDEAGAQAVAAKLPRIVAGQGGAGLDDLGDAAIGEARAAAAVPREGAKQRPLGQARRGEPGGERAGGAAEDRQLEALAGLLSMASCKCMSWKQ